jgi:predicted RNA-binding Zn ribbon-like protein
MDERYPLFSEQGDRIEAALDTTLEATGSLNTDELGSVVEVVAASYQKALQLRYVVEALVATAPEDHAGLAAGLEDVEQILRTLATWHATTQDKLYYVAQRVRLGG